MSDPFWWVDADTGTGPDAGSGPIAVPSSLRAPEHGTLLVLNGIQAGRVLTIEGDERVLGRGREADLVVEDVGASRRHACLRRTTDALGRPHFTIQDLGSKNGTLVNGALVRGEIELHPGDRIQIGYELLLRFALVDSTEERLARQLYDASTRDALTGIFNRRYFAERLESELAFAHRHSVDVAVILLDIDHFKLTNDEHGHLAGDRVLRAVASTISRMIRSEDVFARFGGEEFALLVRGITHANVARFADRVRQAVEWHEVRFGSSTLRVTVSAGVASASELAAGSRSGAGVADMLVACADQRLYAAKLGGRNRVASGD